MELYTRIPGIDKDVSRIFFGTASDVFSKGTEANELLDAAFEMGVQTFDTARKYDNAEMVLGKWIKDRGNREKVVVLSKCGHPLEDGTKRVNEKEMRKDLEESLRNLNTDYIDIYVLHRDDENVPVGEIVDIFNEMYREGKIRAFGGSNWSHRRIAEANAYAKARGLQPFSVSSPNFGLAEQVADLWGGGCVSISGPANEEAREWYRETQMPVIAYSSLGRGLFSGKLKSDHLEELPNVLDEFAQRGYACPANFERLRRCEELAAAKHCTVPQVALAWMFRQGLNIFAVVGRTGASRTRSNLAALQLDLTPAECRWLNLED